VPPTTPITVTNYQSGANIPITPAATTQYTLTSVTGCGVGTGNSGTPTVVVSPTPFPPLTIDALPDAPICAGDPTLLTVKAPGPSTPQTISSTGAITIPDSGPANPYPATLNVAGFPGTGATVTGVTLLGLNHTWSSDLDIALQQPNTGTTVMLLSDVGGAADFINNTMNFADANPLFVAPPAANGTGNVRPTNPGGGDNFPGAGPQNVAANGLLSQFVGNFNGAWRLWINDQVGGDQGSVTGGYRMDFLVPSSAPLPAGYTFLWSPAAGLSNPTANPVGASPMTTTTYTVLVTAPGGCQGTATKTVVVNQPPAITTQPVNAVICATGSTSFSVVATGAGPLTYQWEVQVGGVGAWNPLANVSPYSGVNTATLNINPAGGILSGNKYRCVVTGICNPAATSNAATLTVNALPVVPIIPVGPVCGGVAGINGTALTAGSAVPPVPGSQTFTSGTINVAIPEGNFPTRPATAASNVIAVTGIPANATITGISARINATHPYANDIVAVLKSPTGAVINLDAIGGYANAAGANYLNTTFSSAGTASISTGTAPFTGLWRADLAGVTFTAFGFTLSGGPVGFDPTTTSWATYMGTLGSGAANGNWTLAAYDAGAPDIGNLTKWDLIIDYTTPGTGTGATLTYVWSPTTGLYTNATATTPYTGTNLQTVYAAPTAFTVYTVTATNTTTGCVGTNSVVVNYTPPAPTVTPNPVSMCLGDAAVRLTSASSTSTVLPFTTGIISVPIVDNTPAGTTSTIAVSGIPNNAVITGMKVTVNGTHTWLGDIVMVLKAPGTLGTLNLDYYLGGTGAGPTTNFVNTAFGSAAGLPTIGTASPFTGTFRADGAATGANPPSGPTGMLPTVTTYNALMAAINGGGPGAGNGTYTLGMADYFAGDAGTLTKWDLEITYTVGVQATSATWSPITGLYNNAAATIAYTGDARDTVYARPTTIGANNYDVTVQSVPVPSPSNPTAIAIPSAGNGNPYPSAINVLGYPTTGVSVDTVILHGISHTWGDDIDVLVQSPTGQNVVLMSDIGGADDMVNVTYKFNDNGPAMSATVLNPSGVYKPTNNDTNTDVWPAPGPGAIAQANPTLALFGSTSNVNGQWKLFLVDDVGGDLGSVAGGWTIKFNYNFPACTSPARRVVVTVNQPIAITTQPVNAVVCTDKVTSFTLAATGTTPTYQWQVSANNGNTWTSITNGAPYSGATTATLTITAPAVSLNGNLYRCIVSGAAPCVSVNSATARLTVNPLPTVVISANPYTKLFPGLTTTITTTSSPAAASYVWRKNGTATGATTPAITLDVDGMGDYTVTVTDINGCVNTSNTVTIADSASGKVFIYPNPNSGVFQVRYYSASDRRSPRGINVYDDKGSRIAINQYGNTAPYSRMDVDLRKYSKGVYWIEVVDGNGERLAVGRAVVL
jgi:subtilisin-like proprotein convertase family protein